MKAAVLHELGAVPRYEDFPDPVAGDGEVVVEAIRLGRGGFLLTVSRPARCGRRRGTCRHPDGQHAAVATLRAGVSDLVPTLTGVGPRVSGRRAAGLPVRGAAAPFRES